MTAYPFIPNQIAAFEFQPTLDGVQYSATVTWNIFGRRFYLNLYQLSGTRVITTAVVGSPADYDISLVGGHFVSKLVFRAQSQQFEVTP